MRLQYPQKTGRAPSAPTALPVANEGKRWDDHFVPGLHAASVQAQFKRFCSGGSLPPLRARSGGCDLTLQRLAVRPQDKLLLGQDFFHGGVNFVRYGVELRSQIEHGNHFRGCLWRRCHLGFEWFRQGIGSFTAELCYHAIRHAWVTWMEARESRKSRPHSVPARQEGCSDVVR